MGACRSSPGSVSRESANAWDGSSRVSSCTTMLAWSTSAVFATLIWPSGVRTTQCSPPAKMIGSPWTSEISVPSGPFSVAKASSLKIGQFW